MAIEVDISDLIQKLQDRADRAAQKASQQAGKDVQNELKEATDVAIKRWFGDYPPEYYGGSRGALEDAYEVLDDGEGFVVDFSGKIATHQRNNDMVLDIVVRQGYHGGSYGRDISGIRWRTGLGFSEWGEQAASSQPIIDEVNRKVAELNGKFESKATNLFSKYFISG